jgi:hypothetical protein
MKTRSKIGIFVVVLVALSILALFAYTWQIESARARAIQEDMIDCIEAYGNGTPCAKICEGTLDDSRYSAIKELDIDDCKPYVNEVIDKALSTGNT